MKMSVTNDDIKEIATFVAQLSMFFALMGDVEEGVLEDFVK